MPIFKTAYETTAGARQTKNIEEKIRVAKIKGMFKDRDIAKTALVDWGDTSIDAIEFFNHPLQVDGVLYADVRNFTRLTPYASESTVRNRPEYEWTNVRLNLNKIWLDGRYSAFRDISPLPGKIYAQLLSEVIARKYALDAGEQMHIAVLAAYFYFGLYTNDTSDDEMQNQRLVKNIHTATNIPPTKVQELIEGLGQIANLDEFCKTVATRTESVRLRDFNVGILAAIVGGTWYGTNARENICVALEHPPTWLAVCYACVGEATFKRSALAKLCERLSKGNLGTQFKLMIDDMVSYEAE